MNPTDKTFIGHRTGRLTVKERGYSTRGALYWKCECDCGNIRYYTRQNILKGTLCSCGCFKEECRGKEHKNWKGCGNLSASFVSKIKSQATRRKMKFSLTTKYLWKLFEKQHNRCSLSGVSISLPISAYDATHGNVTASLDRIDSNKGYVGGNVQWVHKDVNMMKQQFSQPRFIELCKLVSKNNE